MAEKSGAKQLVIVGGSDILPDSTAESARKALGISKSSVTRLSGSDRYATSSEVAKWEIEQGMGVTNVAVATGKTFPDALAGAALCGKNDSVLVLAKDTKSVGLKVISNNKAQVEVGYALGGESSVSTSLYSYLESLTM